MKFIFSMLLLISLEATAQSLGEIKQYTLPSTPGKIPDVPMSHALILERR